MRPYVLIPSLPSLVALVAIGVTGCADDRKGPATGSLDGKCYPNGTCDSGLDCDSSGEESLCVAAGTPAGEIGGPCYNNGTCNPGAACQADTCVASEDRGELNGPCYNNATCNSPDLVCNDGTCTEGQTRGRIGGLCYEEGTCNPGLLCEADVCVADDTIPAGTLGGDCLLNGICGDGLVCNGTVCEADPNGETGTAGEACFPNGTCNAGLECVVTNVGPNSAAECAVIDDATGDEGAACFPNGTCNTGFVCYLGSCAVSNSDITEPNGADGGLCYSNGSCDDGLVCNSFGTCEPIVAGGLFGDCRADGSCNLGLSCYVADLAGGTQCLPTVEHLASIHGVVTDYTTNARLENVQVTLIHEGGVEQTVTDELGYYDFDNLNPGQFEVTFASLDGTHTTRRLGRFDGIGVYCYLFEGDQDQHCNQVWDIELFPFTASETGTVWYVNDSEVTPAAGVTVIADYGAAGEADQNTTIDISPDRFITETDADGVFTFDNLPNTGDMGVRIFVAPSTFNGFDYESYSYWANLDIFDNDKVEITLNPSSNPPTIVDNNWEDFLNGGFDIASPITATFSRSMKIEGCKFDLGEGVQGTTEWSSNNTVATFTPFAPLDTDTTYTVRVLNCESAIDDQLFVPVCDLNDSQDRDDLDNDCLKFATQEGIDFVVSNADPLGDSGYEDEFAADADITLVFDMAVDLSVAGTELSLVRVVDLYPGHTDDNDTDELELDVPFAQSADGNIVTLNPTNDLVAGATYRVYFEIFSSIPGDSAESDDYIQFTVEEAGELEFLFADIPVENDNELVHEVDPTTGTFDGNIALTFSKDVNAALSSVTIEEGGHQTGNTGNGSNGFVIDSTFTATGSTIVLDPAINLVPGWYTVRYNVAATDTQGTAVGNFEFRVEPPDTTIEFVDDNLGARTDVNWQNGFNIWLNFSTAIDPNFFGQGPSGRNNVELIDANGEVVDATITRSTVKDENGLDTVVNGRVVINADGALTPDSDYTIRFKVYAAGTSTEDDSGFGTFVQSTITFHTADHIALSGTNVGTIGTPGDLATFVGTEEATPGQNIVLTFTVGPDAPAVFHDAQHIALYRLNNADGAADNDFDLVAATITTVDNVITIDPNVDLEDEGGVYCVTYQLTSAVQLEQNTADGGPGPGLFVEDVSEEAALPPATNDLCFSTAETPEADPVAPTAAPANLVVQDGNLIDYDDNAVTLRFDRVIGAASGTGVTRYEIFAADVRGSVNDVLLVQTVNDDVGLPAPNANRKEVIVNPLCSNPTDALYCYDADGNYSGTPFANNNEVRFFVRACNADGCGPLTVAVTVIAQDQVQPAITVSPDELLLTDRTVLPAITYPVTITTNEPSDLGPVTFTLVGNLAGAAAVVCTPDITAGRNANGWLIDDGSATTDNAIINCTIPAGSNASSVNAQIQARDSSGNASVLFNLEFNVIPAP